MIERGIVFGIVSAMLICTAVYAQEQMAGSPLNEWKGKAEKTDVVSSTEAQGVKYARWLTYKNELRQHPHLVAYWTFEEGAGTTTQNIAVRDPKDTSYDPGKLDATIGATVKWVKDGGRWPGKCALEFNGSTGAATGADRLDVSECQPLRHPYDTDTITIEFWYYVDAINGFASFVHKNGGYEVYYDGSWGGRIGVWLYINNTRTSVVSWEAGGAAILGAWHHVVVTRESNGIAAIYFDGEEKTFSIKTGDFVSTSGNGLVIGSFPGVYSLDGKLDEVAIYDGVLSAREIMNHYEMGKP